MRKKTLTIGISFICVLACTFLVNMFNRYILLSLPRYARLLCMIPVYWVIALEPLILCVRKRISFADLGFCRENIAAQILTGILFALALSVLLTLIPHLAGFGDSVDNGSRYVHLWQYLYEFLYAVAAVGAVEEFVFRGYFYTQFKEASGKEWTAVLGSSVLFGLLHIFQGNLLQVFMLMLLGALFCIASLKVKNCSLLSLIIAHGVYDALISVWSSLLLK